MKGFIKRILCVILAIAMSSTYLLSVTANEGTDGIVSEEVSEAMEVLRTLGIIPDYYDYNTNFNEEISRADFADTVAGLINFSDYTGSEIYYYDVPETHYAYDSICLLTEMGVTNGVGEKIFKPDDIIEDAAAYKIILTILGYNDRAEADGGYPSGYIKTANRLGIYDNTSEDVNVTRSEMLIMLYRAMTTEMFIPVVFLPDGSKRYEVSETDTLLSMYRKVYRETGVVNGAEMVSVTDVGLDSEDDVIIGNRVYASNINLSDMLGEEIEYFVHYESGIDKGTVLWAKRTGNDETVYIEDEDVKEFNKESYILSYYDKSNNLKSIALDRGMTVIYNGREAGRDIDVIFNKTNASIKLIRRDGVYETAIVKAYENYTVGTVSTSAYEIYDWAKPQKALKLDKALYDYMVLRGADGTELSIGNIAVGNVLSAFMSMDGKYLEVTVSASSASGSLEKITETDKGRELTVDGKAYILPAGVETDVLKAGNTVMLYIDFTGKVAYAETLSGSSFAAYVIKSANENIGLGDKLKIKMLKQNGSVVVLECADKVIADGVAVTKADDIEAVFNENGVFKPQIALIDTDSDGKIRNIDTANVRKGTESESSSLSVNVSYKKRYYKSIGFFDRWSVLDNKTVIFLVPDDTLADAAEDDDYTVLKMSDLVNEVQYNVETYKTTDRPSFEEYAVIKKTSDAAGTDGSALPIIAKSISEVLNDDGETVECLEGYQGDAEVSCISDGKLSFTDRGVKPGMLVKTAKDYHGNVCDLQILFDYEKRDTYNTTGQFNIKYGVEIGYVNDVVGEIIKIGYTEPSISEHDHIIKKHNAVVMVYDTKNDKNNIYSGSFTDAKTYYNTRNKEECSSVVMITSWANPLLFVIYN